MSQTIQKSKSEEDKEDSIPSWSELTSRFKTNVLGQKYPLYHLITTLLTSSTILLGANLFVFPASLFYFYLTVNDSGTKTNIISNIGTTIILALTSIWYPTIGSNVILGIAGLLIYWKIKNDTYL